MGKTINQFRRLCYPLSYSAILSESSHLTHSSISSLDTEETDREILNKTNVATDPTEDDEEEDEDDHIFKIDTNIDGNEITWWFGCQICYDLMYVKFDWELKKVKTIEIKSDSTNILIHTRTETGLEEEYKCYSDSPNYFHLRSLLSADNYIISDIVCGNEDHIIQMTLLFLRIDNQLQSIVGLTFITGTKNFMVTTQSTHNDQMKNFLSTPGSTHYPFIEAKL